MKTALYKKEQFRGYDIIAVYLNGEYAKLYVIHGYQINADILADIQYYQNAGYEIQFEL